MRLLDIVSDVRAMNMEAEPERLHEAREWACRIAAEAGLGESDCYQVKLAMSEAVANAIQHGSNHSTDSIHILAMTSADAIVFEVLDTGDFVAPLGQPADEDESGRGLELLTLMMDEVQMTSTGTGSLLRFVKRIG